MIMNMPIDMSLLRGPGFSIVAKATLVLACAAAASLALRRSSASIRHLAWTSAVVAVLVLPVLAIALPSWLLPLLPGPGGDRSHAISPRSSQPPFVEHEPRQPAIFTPAVAATTQGPSSQGTSPRRMTIREDANRETRPSSVSWSRTMARVWGCGTILVGAPWLVAHAWLGLSRRRMMRRLDRPWTELAARLGARLDLPRRVVVIRGTATASPLTWGVFRPVVLLPATADGWPQDRLESVLLHELAHVRRGDCLTQALAGLACALYWFHPLAWLASHRLREERELACDDLVLGAGPKASDYAAHLLDVARASRSSHPLVAVAMARPSQIEGRLRAILDASRCRRPVGRRIAGLMLIIVAAAIMPLASMRLGGRAALAEPIRQEMDATTMSVHGRVLDPDGKAVPRAEVAVVARRKLATGNARSDDQHKTLGRTRADAEGRFSLKVPRTSSVRHYEAKVVAAAPGLGLGWTEFNRDAESPEVVVKLQPERIVAGRLIDLQGAPASRVAIRTASIGFVKSDVGVYDGFNLWQDTPEGLDRVWPERVTTDADGQFQIQGIGPGVKVVMRVDDARYARQSFSLTTGDADAKPVTFSLQPSFAVTGRVTCSDTGEPIRDAIVTVATGSDPFLSGGDTFRTDADGRYEANVRPGSRLLVTAYPPVGSPYLIFGRHLDGNDGLGRREVDLAVPHGVLMTGTITARGGGPLAGASIFYGEGGSNIIEEEGTIPGWMAAVTSGPDGRYAIAVPPGKGNLLVYGPTADFVHQRSSDRELRGKPPGGQRLYAHAFVPYEARRDNDPLAIDVALVPGATIRGRVVGPDGTAIASAEIVTTLSISPFHTFWRGDFTVPVRDGRFELHGVPADRRVRCSFLDARGHLGTTIEVDASSGDAGPLTVRLSPCGTATARLVDGEGKPVAGHTINLNLVGSPGTGTDFGGQSLDKDERTMLQADESIYANVDRVNYWRYPKSDADGRVNLVCLIPGATYRIYEHAPERGPEAYRWRDFTVGSGESLDLGNVRDRGARP